eukprot:TRINITY_DN74892_c0_g1_i1.p1 TRINITY_DN74892_c0_g1~~TRINITY_DN74892_c0_g1_i1.p1  ORF type:complete len:775 (-),score=73.53 TRINITY_DN74892_c0_g1_i1:55-2379(-)
MHGRTCIKYSRAFAMLFSGRSGVVTFGLSAAVVVFMFSWFYIGGGQLREPTNLKLVTLAIGMDDSGHPEAVVSSSGKPSRDAERNVDGKRSVRHVKLLDVPKFWFLMVALVVCVGVAVATMDSQPTADSLSDIEPNSYSYGTMLRLMLCGLAVTACTSLRDVAQEFTMANPYDGEAMPSKIFALFCEWATSAVVFAAILRFKCERMRFHGFSLAGAAAIPKWMSFVWLHRIVGSASLSLQTAAQPTEIVFVVLLSSIRYKRSSFRVYVEAVAMVFALIVLGFEIRPLESHVDATPTNVLLPLFPFVANACTSHIQDIAFRAHFAVSTIQLAFAMSLVAAAGLLVELFLSGSAFNCLGFLVRHPQAGSHLAMVGLATALSQYFIVYIVRNFGPLVSTLIRSMRQMIMLPLMAILFGQQATLLSIVAIVVALTVLVLSALTSLVEKSKTQVGRFQYSLGSIAPVCVCAIAIHVLYCIYAIVQEFLSVHTFQGELFRFPIFTIIVNHTCGGLLAVAMLRLRGKPLYTAQLRLTMLPASSFFMASLCQHQAVYYVLYPTVTLMKNLKVVPVMIVGRMLRNRRYNSSEYIESIMLSILVAYFVSSFQQGSDTAGITWRSAMGALLMTGYLLADALTSNLQDYVFQTTGIDAGQMVVALEAISTGIACVTAFASGQFWLCREFVATHPGVLWRLLVLGLTSAWGSYTCTITVRMFGPAVLTLVMVSRQVASLGISVALFGHQVSWSQSISIVGIASLMLISSFRRVAAQASAKAKASVEV